MKSTILFTLVFVLFYKAQSQKTIIRFEGLLNAKERFYTVDIEGRKFDPAAARQAGTGVRVFEINYLATGRAHDLVVYASNATASATNRQAQPIFNSRFQLKDDHELLIVVGNNGSVELSEKPVKSEPQPDHQLEGMRHPMNMQQFNSLYAAIKNQYNASDRYAILKNALEVPTNYFTVFQMNNLLSLINSESERLMLAKKCFSHLLEEANAAALLDVFSLQASKNELAKYFGIKE